jgi:hypothetical protein
MREPSWRGLVLPRSAIIRLVLAMAFAGLSPFGQALVQFMIV